MAQKKKPVVRRTTQSRLKAATSNKKTSVKSKKRVTRSKNKLQQPLTLVLAGVLVLVVAWIGFTMMRDDDGQPMLSNGGNSLASVSLEASKTVLKPGEPVAVKLYTDSNDVDVNAIQTFLNYPSDILELNSINTENSAFPVQAIQNNQNGTVEVVRGTTSSVKDRQYVYEIQFTAKSSGKADINFVQDKTILVDTTKHENILGSNSFKNISIEVQ